jgi:hypothetical protein
MRDRLIELIQNAVNGCARHWAEIIADHLLSNGVIVPPCKVGDTVYVISETRVKKTNVHELYIDSQNHITISVDFECDDDCDGCPFEAWSQTFCGEWDCDNQYGVAEIKAEDFGKTVFLTKEEAKAALNNKNKGEN